MRTKTLSTAGKARRAWGNENWRAENHFKHTTSAIAPVRPAVELEVVEVCASAEGPAWGREGFADRDKEVTMKEKTLGTKLLLAAVTLGVLAYFSIQAVRYFGDPLTTTIAYQYQVEMSTVLSRDCQSQSRKNKIFHAVCPHNAEDRNLNRKGQQEHKTNPVIGQRHGNDPKQVNCFIE